MRRVWTGTDALRLYRLYLQKQVVQAILGLHGSSKTQWERGTNWKVNGCVEWGGFACQSWLSSSSHKPTFTFIFLDEPEWTPTHFSWVWCWSHVVFNTCSSVDKSLLRRTRERVSDPQSFVQSKQDQNSYFQISLVMDYYARLFCICSVLGNSFCPIVLQILTCSHHNLWGSHPSSPSLEWSLI